MKYLLLIVAFVMATSGQIQAQETPPQTELLPGWWYLPKTQTKMKIGGYVKFDMIHDFNPIGSPDFFDVTKIPTDGSEGQSTHLNAKEARVFLDFRTPSKVGEMRAYIEGDFYGANGTFRLRHAFVEIGDKWLAGQWWSNFMDESIIPGTLDFEMPAAYVFMRHPIIRYKQAISKDAYLAFALEEPGTKAQAPSGLGKYESPLPDFTARYRLTKAWGHVQLSAFAGLLQYRYDTAGTDNVPLYGVNLSGQINLLKKDKFIYQAVYGPGVGRFRGGISAGLDENGDIQPLTDLGITVGYQHQWTKEFTSMVVYNQGALDNTAMQPDNSLHITTYFAANLLWHFVDNAYVGIEYLHGTREDKNKDFGAANRLQMSMKYSFN